MITLENREPRLRTYEIPVAVGGGEVHALGATERTSDAAVKAGAATLRVHVRTLPSTLTLTARGTDGSISASLPDAYAEAPQIAAAIAARKIVKHDVPIPATSSPSTAPSSGTAPTPPTDTTGEE